MASEQTRLSAIGGYRLLATGAVAADDSPPQLHGSEATAAVAGGAAVAITDGLDEDTKADVLNTLLLAQLVANGEADRQKETDKWYSTFKEVLETVGWVVTGFTFVENKISEASVSVDALVIKYMQASLTAPQLAAVQGMIDLLRERADSDPDITLFNTQTTNDNQSNFQLGACSASQDGTAVMAMGAFTYDVQSRITNALFTKLHGGSAHFFSSSQKMQLSKAQYTGAIRQQVKDKLTEHASDKIKSWKLGKPTGK
ncbi:hypothetical protein FRC09_020315 [Ceratobasidium sp. 395]|nr:hypothetical protein FRC09_020315 [Ceratobasidium sp. 395]